MQDVMRPGSFEFARADPQGKRQIPTELAHYTNHAGFDGILKSRTLWATEIKALNDISEQEAFNIAQVGAMVASIDADSATEALNEAVLRGISAAARRDVFVSCLSDNADQLSQWRGYAVSTDPKSDRRGYAIIFDTFRLAQVAGESGFDLLKCVYSAFDLNVMVSDHLTSAAVWLDIVGARKSDDQDDVTDAVARQTEEWLIRTAPRYKNTAFSEESEWRLMGLESSTHDLQKIPPDESRPNRKRVAIPISNSSGSLAEIVKRVVVSPTFPPSGWECAQRLLHEAGLSVEIKKSEIPYRYV